MPCSTLHFVGSNDVAEHPSAIILDIAEYLWSDRLSSLSYTLITSICNADAPGLLHVESELNVDQAILDLFPTIFALKPSAIFSDGRDRASTGRIDIDISPIKEGCFMFEEGLLVVEYLHSLKLYFTCKLSSKRLTGHHTYEVYTGLPFSSGKRDGLYITNYTSLFFLPDYCKPPRREALIVDDTKNWTSIDFYTSDMIIVPAMKANNLVGCITTYAEFQFQAGYYVWNVHFENSSNIELMFNIYGVTEQQLGVDIQAYINDSTARVNGVEKLGIQREGPSTKLSIQCRLYSDLRSVSLKIFANPLAVDKNQDPYFVIRDMDFFRINEAWGN